MNEAIKHQQAALEEMLDILVNFTYIDHKDARLISAAEHLDAAREIIGDSDEQ
jgi:hypothetical protein